MMPFHRLRRKVALIICPEMTVEVRLKATLAESRALRSGMSIVRKPSLWQRLVRLNRRIEDCWIGDFIGACALFALLPMLMIIGLGFGW